MTRGVARAPVAVLALVTLLAMIYPACRTASVRQAGSSSAAAAPAAVSLREFTYTEVHMGMPVRIVLYASTDDEARAAARAAFDRVAALDATMSDYRPDSEVSHVNHNAGTWVAVSAELRAVLARARQIAALTEGAFDPTIGSLIALWRDARRTRQLPAPDALASARSRIGWRALEEDDARRSVRLARPGMALDLGGIAKGFILQMAVDLLRARGSHQVMLQAGGDIVVGNAPPGRAGWRVSVPGASPALAGAASALANAALATSGPTFQFVEIDGTRYSHVVDPRTGLGVTTGRLVYVIASDGATADAVATAASVTGECLLELDEVRQCSVVPLPLTSAQDDLALRSGANQ